MAEGPGGAPAGGRGWPLIAALAGVEERIGRRMERRGPGAAAAYEVLRFGVKQAWACLFGGALLALIAGSRLCYPRGAALSRYDALVLAGLGLQALLLAFGLETLAEAGVILVFHAVGTAMEVFKTAVGSWTYPEASRLRIGGVPLFTGFMYAAVGSYIARAWRVFAFRFTRHPGLSALVPLCLAIYANFFSDHWGLDLRWALIGAAVLLFRRTTVYFTVWRVERRMPLLLGLLLVSLFVWFGENIATAAGAWLYPGQRWGWRPVGPAKLASWFLLMLVSYTLVASLEGRSRPGRSASAGVGEG